MGTVEGEGAREAQRSLSPRSRPALLPRGEPWWNHRLAELLSRPARLLCPWGFSGKRIKGGYRFPSPGGLPGVSSASQADSLPAEPSGNLDPKQGIWSLLFQPGAAVLEMTTRGRAVPTLLHGGQPRVILGVHLPLTQQAPFIVSLQAHSVSCSEAGGDSATLC